MAQIKFGNELETVITREEITVENAKDILKNEVIAILGYGVQGPAQALNLKDNGFNVIVGQRKNSKSWNKAIKDGWVENENLFSLKDACYKGTILCNLLSDAGQISTWPTIKKYLTEGKSLYFSHGFGITYNNQTNIIPPKNIDVFLVAPKGSGNSLRKLFLNDKGLNSSYAIYQDASGKAELKAKAFGIGIGSGYLFKTTFKKEVFSDLTGERGVLMGALSGLIEAQYQVLRENGHSPSEAFNETVEELTQSLVPLIGENGMDWMFSNCSTTAQRGALDWAPKFRDTNIDLFRNLYNDVKEGKEANRTITKNSKSDYRENLEIELQDLQNKEIWQVGKVVRKLRPVLDNS